MKKNISTTSLVTIVFIVILCGIIFLFRKDIEKLFLSQDQIVAHCTKHTDSESCRKDSWCTEIEIYCSNEAGCKNHYSCYAK